VSHHDGQRDEVEAARALIEELLRASLALGGTLASLLEVLPEGTFPGEDGAAALVELVLGDSLPAIVAGGERDRWAATALIGALRERVLDDLRLAADLSASERLPAQRRPA
jgi:hypothetical protein